MSNPGAAAGIFGVTGVNAIGVYAVVSGTNSVAVSAVASDPTSQALVADGYSKLGTNAPAIKMKKLTGVISNSTGVQIPISHGLTQSKILSVEIFILANTGNDIPPHSTYSGFVYDYFVSSNNIVIQPISGNDSSILNANFRVLITYEQ